MNKILCTLSYFTCLTLMTLNFSYGSGFRIVEGTEEDALRENIYLYSSREIPDDMRFYLPTDIESDAIFLLVKVLDIHNNGLDYFPISFTGLNYLTKLNISDNGLRDLPEEFANLQSLTHLNASKNAFQEIPTALFSITALKLLNLRKNNIREISDEIVALQNLKILYMAGNKAEVLHFFISDEGYKMSSLKILEIDSGNVSLKKERKKLKKSNKAQKKREIKIVKLAKKSKR